VAPLGLADRLRLTARLAACGAWTVACYLVWLPGALLTLGSARAGQAWNDWMVRAWSRGLVATMGVQIRVAGQPPRKPFFLVSNHLSYLDVLVLASRLGCTFISKHELARWPILGYLARSTGTIFINRQRKRDAVRVLAEIDRAVARRAGVVLFPEGTSTRGDRILPLRPALLQWAAERRHPVHVATIRYETDDRRRPADTWVCWWGEMQFVPHLLGLLALRRIRAVLTFADTPVVADDRTRLADRVAAALRAYFAPSGPTPA
jgi:1-acyl-sn-glycerol-3-phosphate acyltransferase